MGTIIAIILVVISLIYNIAKKNHIKSNILAVLMLAILSGIILIGFAKDNLFYIINTIYTAIVLILAILAILFVIKDIKVIKGVKSISLIFIVLTYIAINFLARSNYVVSFIASQELRKIATLTIDITLLLMFEVNLFINLINNTKKNIKSE